MSGLDAAALDVARELIPATVRRWIYVGAALAGYGLTAAAVGMTTAGVAVPSQVTVSLAVLGALVGPLGQLAATNVTPPAAVVTSAALTLDDGPAVDLPDGGFGPEPDPDEDEPEPVEPDPATAV